MTSPLSERESQALSLIRKSLRSRGRPPSVRELQREMGYRSPRAAAQVIERLCERGLVERGPDRRLRLIASEEAEDDRVRTTLVPLVGSVACGQPLLAEENTRSRIPVSLDLARPPHRYFLLRSVGDSMDAAGIPDGSLVLVRQQNVAKDGDRVVALIDDEATIKVLRRSPDAVMLCPRSTNPKHLPIILSQDFIVQGVVVAAVPTAD